MSTTPPSQATTFERIEVSGRSVAEASRLFDRFSSGAHFEPIGPPGPHSFRYVSLGDATVSLRMSSSTGSLIREVSRLDDYLVTWFREGGGSVTVQGAVVELRPGYPVALPSSGPFTLEMRPGRQNLVHVARPFLDSVATELHGGPPQPIEFFSERTPEGAALADWRRVMSKATPVITDPTAGPLVRMETNLAVARVVLGAFPWQTHLVPSVLLVPRLARVRAAAEFLNENAHLPITPADAAAAAGLHTRSMQAAFQKHLAASPTEYLRRIRLDRVRRDLLENSPKTARVNDLARVWGFGNLGRFAAAYQERFGEKPSETLRRS